MPTRITPAGNQVANTPIPVSFGNGVAGGYIGYVEDTTGQSGITTETTISGLSFAVTVNSTRRLLITAKTKVSSTVGGDTGTYRIKEGGTVLDAFDFALTAGGGPGAIGIQFSAIITPSAGSHTYSLTLVRTSGSGTLTHSATSSVKSWLLVEDIGPA